MFNFQNVDLDRHGGEEGLSPTLRPAFKKK